MSESELKKMRWAALIPLSGSARAFVREVCTFARRMDTDVRFHFSGEESKATRSTVLSLFPDGMAPDREHLEIRDKATEEMVEEAVGRDDPDLFILEAMERDEAEGVLAPQQVAHLLRDLPASFLLMKESAPKRTRLRRIVCSLSLDEQGEQMLALCTSLCTHCFPDRLHLVREVRGAKDDIVPPDRVIEMEGQMLRSFVGDQFDVESEVTLAAVPYLDGEGLFNYTRAREAELAIMPAPARNDSFWSRLFDPGDEPYYSELPCWLLLYRERRLSKREA